MGSIEYGLSSCGTCVHLLLAMWDLPGPRMKPMSSALAGGFLTTRPPASPKPQIYCFKIFKSQEHGRNSMMNTYTPSPGSSAVSVFPYFLHLFYNLYFSEL